MDSPCKECRWCVSELITHDSWAGNQYELECEEGAPSEVFLSEWGCYMYEQYEDD